MKRSQVSQDSRKRSKSSDTVQQIFKKCGLIIDSDPEKFIIEVDAFIFIQRLKKSLEDHVDYPRNVSGFVEHLKTQWEDVNKLKQYIFPNIVRRYDESLHAFSDGLFKLLLKVPPLQHSLAEYILNRAIDFLYEEDGLGWIKEILRCLSRTDLSINPGIVTTGLMQLIHATDKRAIRLEIITALPEIVCDYVENGVATELNALFTEDSQLTPAILKCWSEMCLPDEEFRGIQRKSIAILKTPAIPFRFFPDFVRFLLSGRPEEDYCSEAIEGLRQALDWSAASKETPQEIADSQISTSSAILSIIINPKTVAKVWLKSIAACRTPADHKPLDLVVLIMLHSTPCGYEKTVENTLKKQIKSSALNTKTLDRTFKEMKPVLKTYVEDMVVIANYLMKIKSESELVDFALHWLRLMFVELENSRNLIIMDLLHAGRSNKNTHAMLSVMSEIADQDIRLLDAHGLQLLRLLDWISEYGIEETREIMGLLCRLASQDSVIKEDIDMIIRKQLASWERELKAKGVIAACQCIRYLIENNDVTEPSNENSEDSDAPINLPEGPIKDAAQLVELIAMNTVKFVDLTILYYDELSLIIQNARSVNKTFLAWLRKAVTNDLQNDYIVEEATAPINDIHLSIQLRLNEEDEEQDILAINIGELVLSAGTERSKACVLPALGRLLLTVNAEDISSIDALIGCSIVMPVFDPDTCTDEFVRDQIFMILDCHVICIEWFRELVNGFAVQTDPVYRKKVLLRLKDIANLEKAINTIMFNLKCPYKPPACTISAVSSIMEGLNTKPQIPKRSGSKVKKSNEKPSKDDTVIPQTAQTSNTQAIPIRAHTVSDKISFRKLNLNTICLLEMELSFKEEECRLTLSGLNFLLQNINAELEAVLVSQIKKTTFLTKTEPSIYKPKKAAEYASKAAKYMGRILSFLEDICRRITSDANETNDIFVDSENLEYHSCIQKLLNFVSIFFRWIGFKSTEQSNLLKHTCREIAEKSYENVQQMNQTVLFVSCATYLLKYKEACKGNLYTAVGLVNCIKAFCDLCDDKRISMNLKELAAYFLTQTFQTGQGIEKGLVFNQNLDALIISLFRKPDLDTIDALCLEVKAEVGELCSIKNSKLKMFPSITKSNFAILYRGMCGSLCEAATSQVSKGLSNTEHLTLWRKICIVLKCLTEIAAIVDNRNCYSAFMKRSVHIVKLFLSQGMPMMELMLKTETDSVVEILRLFQRSTRFIHSLCCQSRIKQDTALISKVPQIKSLLQTLVYRVKDALAANKCDNGFWMGSLVNKTVKGDIVASQQSVADGENGTEDDEDQLPPDDEDVSLDESDGDCKSVSNIV